MSVTVPPTTYIQAVNNLTLPAGQKAVLLSRIPTQGNVRLELEQPEIPLLQEILKLNIARTTRTRIAQYLAQALGQIPTRATTVPTLTEEMSGFSLCLAKLQGMQGQPMEFRLLGRWYPFRLPKVELLTYRKQVKGLVLTIRWQMVHNTHTVFRYVLKENFNELYQGKTLEDILLNLDIRPYVAPDDPDQRPERLIPLSIGLAENYGQQVWVSNRVLVEKVDRSNRYVSDGFSWQVERTIREPEKAIIEPDLELGDRRVLRCGPHDTEETNGILPFVRAYSLHSRTYLYLDYRDVQPYRYQTDVDKRLLLPANHRRLLDKLFQADDALIQDLIPGKTGGLCVLAYGHPGTGKTLTAEVYAEIKERPLYALTAAEVGIKPTEIEVSLDRVFARISRWNAVLLFDECDVFLSTRTEDLQQAATVGMFLRLLDYYTGMLFLTTNRQVMLDPAIDSRLIARLHFPDLGTEERETIWQSLLAEANLACPDKLLGELANLPLDGRKIRNFVRLLQLEKTPKVTKELVDELLPYVLGCQAAQ